MVLVGARMRGGQVEFDVPVSVAYAFLADPRNRPEWQSSLTRVEMLDEGAPRVGMRWRDHTAARLVADMEITVLEPGEVWAEAGQWRALSAMLVLSFEPTATGCAVDVTFRVRGRGLLAPVGWLATGAGLLPVRGDIRRAARVLAARTH